jgi:hypothetical protein
MSLHETRGSSAVKTWVRLALPALPEVEQQDLVQLLIEALAEDVEFDFEADKLQ